MVPAMFCSNTQLARVTICRSRLGIAMQFGSAALGTLIVAAVAAGADPALRERVDRLVQPYLDADVVMGMTIGIVARGRSHAYGYGRYSAADARLPDGDTVYEIASVTKVFTGLLLADAVVEGGVSLDQPAEEMLPAGVVMPRQRDRPITLGDLATHVSGLPRLPDNFAPADDNNPYADYTRDRLHAFLNRHQLRRPPGTKFEYSNLGMGLLGRLLASERGTDYEGLLRERIAVPLRMTSTTITLSDEQRARLAPPHRADGRPSTNWDIPTLAGGGGIRSTVSDMLRFMQAMLDPPDGSLGEAINLAWQVHQEPLAEGDFAMGLGWHVARDGHTRWHNGQTGGYRSMLLVGRQANAAVLVLSNTATGEVDRLAEDLLRMLAGTDVQPRTFEVDEAGKCTAVELFENGVQR